MEQTSPEYAANLKGGQVVPPVDTPASGAAFFSIDALNRRYFDVSFNHLTSQTTRIGIYRNGTLLYDIFDLLEQEPGFGSPVRGSLALDELLLPDLNSGNLDVLVSTSDHPNGEIGGPVLLVDQHIVEGRSGVTVGVRDFGNAQTGPIPNVLGVTQWGLIILAALMTAAVVWRRLIMRVG